MGNLLVAYQCLTVYSAESSPTTVYWLCLTLKLPMLIKPIQCVEIDVKPQINQTKYMLTKRMYHGDIDGS